MQGQVALLMSSPNKSAKLVSECGICNGSVVKHTKNTAINEHLGISKVSARWLSRNMNMQDRQQRVESDQVLLQVYNANPEDFQTRLVVKKMKLRFTTGIKMLKKSPCNGNDRKKFHTQPSASKVVTTVFWDSKGIILIDYKPAGTSFTG